MRHAVPVLVLCWMLSNFSATAQESAAPESQPEELDITVTIPELGTTFLSAIIDSNRVYLPVVDLFLFMKVRAETEAEQHLIHGFFVNEENKYTVDVDQNVIALGMKQAALERVEYRITESRIYLLTSTFEKIFGLHCEFNFRALSVILTSDLELPVIRELKRDRLRTNLLRLITPEEDYRGFVTERSNDWFSAGTLDWNIHYSRMNAANQLTMVSSTIGYLIFSGDFRFSYTGAVPEANNNNFTWAWRYVDNNAKFLKQIMLGDISGIGHIQQGERPFGFQFTNRSTHSKKLFGTYTLHDNTEPGWTVELYLNNRIVDYAKADELGMFHFEIPIRYGSSALTLKFYGPWGEEKSKERIVQIPYTFLPQGESQYTISGGGIHESESIFFDANLKTGLTKSITVGGGVHWKTQSTSPLVLPYANSALRIFDALILSTDYTYGIGTSWSLHYTTTTNISTEFSYKNNTRNTIPQDPSSTNESGLTVSFPIRIADVPGVSKVKFSRLQTNSVNILSSEFAYTSRLLGVPVSYSLSGTWIEQSSVYKQLGMRSSLLTSFVLAQSISMRVQGEYDHFQNAIVQIQGILEKSLAKNFYGSLAITHNFVTKSPSGTFTFRYDFSSAKVISSIKSGSDGTITSVGAGGSMSFDNMSRTLIVNNTSRINTGGISLTSFLDKNNNGRKEIDEPALKGIEVEIESGEINPMNDTITQITKLEPYKVHSIKLSPRGLENIAWQPAYTSIGVYIEPNIMTSLEIPIVISGEVNGTVMKITKGGEYGFPGMMIYFYSQDGTLVDTTATSSDGMFDFIGLKPGKYYATLDAKLLLAYGMKASQEKIEFEIKQSIEGDIVNDINFTLGQ